MKVSQITERELVARISSLLSKQKNNVIVGAGEDDCAILDIGKDNYLVATTDMLHRKTDFPEKMSGWQIGWMSVAVNLSDLASKGAKPIGLLMAVGIPKNTNVEFVEEIVIGMNECAETFETQIIGGDTDSHDELTIVGTALGLIKKEHLIKRSGAKVGDLVCMTGSAGGAGAGLYALEKNISVNEKILKALFEPMPRIKEGIALSGSGCITSMMDISDGLALSLYDLKNASNVGFKIYENKIPISLEVLELLKGEKLFETVVFVGGEFELLFTVSPHNIEIVKKACNFTVIGEVIEDGVFIERDGKLEKLKPKGYEHFNIYA